MIEMQVHTFELRHDCGENMELVITNTLSREGIVIPLSDDELEDLVRTLDI